MIDRQRGKRETDFKKTDKQAGRQTIRRKVIDRYRQRGEEDRLQKGIQTDR